MSNTNIVSIESVYVDSSGLPESVVEPRTILSDALGRLAIDQAATVSDADAMVVFGGDGAFLHALRKHNFPDIPVTGINTGTLGFYMDTLPTEEHIENMAACLAVGRFVVKRLPLLEVPQRDAASAYAVNEVVVARKSLQAFKASLRLGAGEFEHFVGDGFIFATPQGSTSYSLSAGGPVLQEDVPAYVVTPSNPHTSHNYYSLTAPAVVSAETEAVLQVKEVEKRPFVVSVDDEMLDWPDDEHEVRIRVAQDKRLQIVRFDGHDYFQHVSDAFRGKKL